MIISTGKALSTQLFAHHPFTELFSHQFSPIENGPFVEMALFADLHFNVEQTPMFSFGLDIEYGEFSCPVIGKVIGTIIALSREISKS